MAPEPSAQLDLRAVRAFVSREDGDLLIMVHDDDVAITLESGAGGEAILAINGAERLAEACTQYAELMRVRLGSKPRKASGRLSLVEDDEMPYVSTDSGIS